MTSSEREKDHHRSSVLYFGFQPQNLKRSEDLKSIQFQHPGISYAGTDRHGKSSVQGLLLAIAWVDEVILGSETDKSLFALDWTNRENMIFIADFEMNVSKAIYSKDFRKESFTCHSVCTDLGRSSMTIEVCLLAANETEPVISATHRSVNVDPHSRKASPWPSWLSDKFKSKLSYAARSQNRQFGRPQNSFIQSVIVVPSDTDANGHCNFASYAKFADDALHTALRLRHIEETALQQSTHGSNSLTRTLSSEEKDFLFSCGSPSAALKGISPQAVKGGIKNFKIRFFQECHEGQRLNVHIWQDGIKDTVVYSSIEKEDKVICQIVMEFFFNDSKL